MKLFKLPFLISCLLVTIIGYAQNQHSSSGLKKVTVQEVLQVESYTYLKVDENNTSKWLAVPRMEAKNGDVYYYQGGMLMKSFKSTELDKVFDEIYFLGSITNANAIDMDKGVVDPNEVKNTITPAKKPTLSKLELSIDSIDGGIRISKLFENPLTYEGVKVKIKGEVTKFSSGIMGKNWVHFQDGTEYDGAYDFMITTQETVSVGDIIIFEGIISLNKDFGAGYFYKILMEEASIIR